MPNRTAQNHIVFVAFLTVAVTIVAAVGPVEGMFEFLPSDLGAQRFLLSVQKEEKVWVSSSQLQFLRPQQPYQYPRFIQREE